MAASNSLDHLSNRMKLEWHSKLNTEMVPAKNFRRTSIIGTIGMSCSGLGFLSLWLVGAIVLMSIFFFFSGPKTNSTEKINALRRGMAILDQEGQEGI